MAAAGSRRRSKSPAPPEEVWQAIATGPGISSWFVPSEVEEREGGTAVSHFGPGDSMDSVGTVTAWEPPHRFVVDSRDELGEGASIGRLRVDRRDEGRRHLRRARRP